MKTKDDIFAFIKNVLVTQFECDEDVVSLEARLYEDLDLDSIDAVDMVVALQKEIKKSVDPKEYQEVKTVQDIVDTAYRLLS